MFVKQYKKDGETLPSVPSNLSKPRPASPMPTTAATTQADGPAANAALNGEPASNVAPPSSISVPTSPSYTVPMAATSQPPQLLAEATTDAEVQQIATSRALAKAKEILQGGGTQAEAAEAAKIVAREILREFQLSKQTQTRQSGLGEMDFDVVSKEGRAQPSFLVFYSFNHL